ncbi:isochorismatase family protein [Nocardia sp.]|uniref:isochorismatase family protein n=1 Tax=Nocardia sp. TaxID=1821 RepID=UPI003453E6B5
MPRSTVDIRDIPCELPEFRRHSRRCAERRRRRRSPARRRCGSDRARIPGSEPWQIVPELTRADDELRLNKRYGDSFEDTDLEAILARLEIGRLFVAGAQTDACIRSTLHGAFVRGYNTVLVSDAHTTEDLSPWGAPSPEAVIRHINLYWQHTTAPGRTAAAITTDNIDFAN